MRILYDHQIFTYQNYGGISRYFYELLNYFQKDEEVSATISLVLSNNRYIKDCAFSSHYNLLPKFNFRGKGRMFNGINKLTTIRKLHTIEYDIFHPTYYDPFFLKYIGNKPFVLTVYDMIHEKYKEMYTAYNQKNIYNTTRYKKLLAQKASHIIAISYSTKQDIVDILKIDESRISVVHLGNSLVVPDNSMQLLTNVPEDFILFVGSRLLYKNFTRFITAASEVLQHNIGLTVVCVGGGTFNQEELSLFGTLGIRGQVVHFSLDDLALSQLYKNALFFVFPSLCEGFGIPILEAFACNCPLLCSKSSSFPEVAGNAALYFDPNSIDSIHDAIKKAVEDSNLRSELKVKGSLRVKEFSLEKTALETKDIYRKLI